MICPNGPVSVRSLGLGSDTASTYNTSPPASVQAKPAEVANSLLAGLVDLPALAEDRVRTEGYAPFFRGDPPRPVADDAAADPPALVRGAAHDAAGLDRDRFVEAADDPGVGVAGAEGRGGIEGALGQVSHQDHAA